MDKSQCKKDTNWIISSPKDVKTDEWKDDIREWPQLEYGDIYNYMVLSRACDGEEMKNYNHWTATIILKAVLSGKFFILLLTRELF